MDNEEAKESIRKAIQEWVKQKSKELNLPEEFIMQEVLDTLTVQVDQLIINKGNHYENTQIFYKAEEVKVGVPKKIVVQKDERIHASSEQVSEIQIKVSELAELIRKAGHHGIPKSHLKLNFSFNYNNPHPSIHSELRRRFRYANINLIPKRKVEYINRVLSGWISNVAGVLYKKGIPPYSKNIIIRKLWGVCKERGIDPEEHIFLKYGVSIGEADPLILFKEYRSIKNRKKRRKQ